MELLQHFWMSRPMERMQGLFIPTGFSVGCGVAVAGLFEVFPKVLTTSG